MLASMSASSRERWSEVHRLTLEAYNRTVHTIIKNAPCVVLYSWLCTKLEEVPEVYRDLLAAELKKYDCWASMKAIVISETKVLSLIAIAIWTLIIYVSSLL
jgi:hypothetical protein